MEQIKVELEIFGGWGEGRLSAGVGVGGTIHEGRTHEVPWGEGGGIHGILVSQTQTGNNVK